MCRKAAVLFHKVANVSMHISEIQKQAHELAQKHGWQKHDIDQRFHHLISEIDELSRELLRYASPDARKKDVDRAVGYEIYDIVWNLCELANQLDIDLEPYFLEKIEINRKRSWK